jgi:hypothetical protein
MESNALSSAQRGMPRWREKQRALSIGEKVDLIGRLIQETRQLEAIKKTCKPSVTPSVSDPHPHLTRPHPEREV